MNKRTQQKNNKLGTTIKRTRVNKRKQTKT